jgi:hypothetical protein
MTDVKHQQAQAQHLEAAAHPERGPFPGLLSHTTLLVARQAHVPHGQKLYAVEHQAHPVQHQSLPMNQDHQE